MIHRAEHTKDFLVVSSDIMRDPRLSWDARGFMVYLLSFNDDWSFNIRGLSSLTGASKGTILRIVKELKDAGYITQTKRQDKSGRFESCEWEIYETPLAPCSKNTEHGENRTRQTPNTVKTEYGNLGRNKYQSITNINLKEISKGNKEEEIKEKTPLGEFQNVFLTLEEISKLKLQLGDEGLNKYIEDLGDYLKEHPRKKYASHYRTILKWAERDKARAPAHCRPKEETDVIDWDELRRLAEERDRQKAGGMP